MSTSSTPDLAELFAANRRHWDERTAVHLGPGGYDLAALRNGTRRLSEIEEAELAEMIGPLAGRRVIHLQCHFGLDTLVLAQRGADVVGVDFSPDAIRAAHGLAAELGLTRARFVECNVYDAPTAVGEAGFDLAFVTWGAIGWLPDIRGWARVAAHFLAPGGRLYLLDAHPSALVLDDRAKGADGRPGWFAPYFEGEPLVLDEPSDVDRAARLENSRCYAWMHPLGEIVQAAIDAGLTIRFLREHDAAAWRMFEELVEGADGLYRWPDRPWWPLSFSLLAEKA
jgi:SAM-dependent methyltransferase